MNELENIFRSTKNSSELLMLNERLKILHENGSILIKVNLFDIFILKKFFNKKE